jgi:hypothetical protein
MDDPPGAHAGKAAAIARRRLKPTLVLTPVGRRKRFEAG